MTFGTIVGAPFKSLDGIDLVRQRGKRLLDLLDGCRISVIFELEEDGVLEFLFDFILLRLPPIIADKDIFHVWLELVSKLTCVSGVRKIDLSTCFIFES